MIIRINPAGRIPTIGPNDEVVNARGTMHEYDERGARLETCGMQTIANRWSMDGLRCN